MRRIGRAGASRFGSVHDVGQVGQVGYIAESVVRSSAYVGGFREEEAEGHSLDGHDVDGSIAVLSAS